MDEGGEGPRPDVPDIVETKRKGVLSTLQKAISGLLETFDTAIPKVKPEDITPAVVAQRIQEHILAGHLRTGRDGSDIEFQIDSVLDKLGYDVSSDPNTPEYRATRQAIYILARDGALYMRQIQPDESPNGKESLVYWIGDKRDRLQEAVEGRLQPQPENAPDTPQIPT